MRAPTTRANVKRPRRDIAKAVPPKFVEPQLCLLAKTAPSGDGWVHEAKIDGYRGAVRIEGGRLQFLTRTGLDWTDKYPAAIKALKKIKAKSAYIDGELCAVDNEGLPNFSLMQNAHDLTQDYRLVYYAFDLLHLNGTDVSSLPLGERKALLQPLVDGIEGLQFNAHIEGDGEAYRKQACSLGLEGIVSKRIDAPYLPGNRGVWIKTKCTNRQEFVVVGWTNPDKSRVGFGALLLGYYDEAGKLIYAGRVGTGFSDKLLREILKKLQPLEIKKMPLDEPPPKGGRGKPLRPATTHWMKPKLVAEITYMTWEADGLLRHTSFVGLRSDKPAKQVRMERPA